jgi:hypothetical protein
MTRTYKQLTGDGDPVPFIRWPETGPAILEAVVLSEWAGEFGAILRVRVESAYSGDTGDGDLLGIMGKGDEQSETPILPGDEINVGLSPAGLQRLEHAPTGAAIRIAFKGWGKTKSGNRFRRFVVGLAEPDAADGRDEAGAAGPGLDESWEPPANVT